MHIDEIMTRDVYVAAPEETVRDVAKHMVALDVGFLPVADDKGVIGIITDRDIVIRAIAPGFSSEIPVGDIMTREVTWCYGDETIEDVSRHMMQSHVSRIVVVDRDYQLTGVVSLAEIARWDPRMAGVALSEMARHDLTAPLASSL